MARFEEFFPIEHAARMAADGIGFGGALAVPFPDELTRADLFLPSDYAVTLMDPGPHQAAYARANYTGRQLFDQQSAARDNPAHEFFVNLSGGSDNNSGLTEALAFSSLGRAITAANTAGGPTRVMVRGGTETHGARNFSLGQFVTGGLYDPAVDIAFVFYNGPTVVGSHAANMTASLHSSAAYTYAVATTLVDQVVDLSDVDDFGIPMPMQYVPFVASGDLPPGCWSYDGTGICIIRRRDGAAVASANTRIIRQVSNFRCSRNVSIGIFGDTDADTVRLEGGGSANSPFDITIQTDTNMTRRAVVLERVASSPYCFLGGAGRGFSVDGLHGLALLDRCLGVNARSDSFNFHSSRGAFLNNVAPALTRPVTINCIGRAAGIDRRASGQSNTGSCNHWTIHEDVFGADFGGDFRDASGGAVRNINATKMLAAGTLSHDRGDVRLGSVTRPTAFRADDSARIWKFRTRAPLSSVAAQYTDYTTTGALILARQEWPDRGVRFGNIGGW